MTPDASATLVWLAPEGENASGASDARTSRQEAARALERWARAHDVTLAPPSADDVRALVVDLAVSDRVEQEIERARDAIAAQDADAAERALARAEAEIHAHPELPHAAWLLAEIERGWAARFTRLAPVDIERAERAWLRAAGLDGGRVSGIGEPHVALARGAPAHATVAITGGARGESIASFTLSLDGTELAAGPFARSAGAHQLVVMHDGAPVWAAWVTIAEGTALRIAAPASPACSRGDVARARLRVDTANAAASPNPIDATGVRCARWIAAVPSARRVAASTSVLVASCEADHCGALALWRGASETSPPRPPPPPVASSSTWPAWATWGLVGGGAAVVAGIVVVATGALAPARTETRFVNGGVKTERTPVTPGLSFGF
jgi:hypothetical protein